jgi:hypothetical protein
MRKKYRCIRSPARPRPVECNGSQPHKHSDMTGEIDDPGMDYALAGSFDEAGNQGEAAIGVSESFGVQSIRSKLIHQ